ncbi:MAG TPA: hypothetical protein VID94_13355 [Acidimicrobiales bacterium]
MPELPRIHFNPVLSPFSDLRLGPPDPRPPTPERRDVSTGSLRSMGAAGSILSIGSAGSILSIGSAGSILSVGSAASVLAIGSFASVASIGSALSIGALGGWAQHPGRVVEVATTALTLGALVAATRRC